MTCLVEDSLCSHNPRHARKQNSYAPLDFVAITEKRDTGYIYKKRATPFRLLRHQLGIFLEYFMIFV